MKDFNLHFGGHFDDLGKVIETAKVFVEELEKAGVKFDHSHFSSGHLLGGTRHDLRDINEENPVRFADGTTHPILPETPGETSPEEPTEAEN